MEIRKDVPEELKNETVNGNKRVVTEKLPEKFSKKIQETLKRKQQELNRLLQLTINILNAQEDQRNIVAKLKNIKESVTNNLNLAFKKMRLNKKQGYNWRFDGRDSFIGVCNPKVQRNKNSEQDKK